MKPVEVCHVCGKKRPPNRQRGYSWVEDEQKVWFCSRFCMAAYSKVICYGGY